MYKYNGYDIITGTLAYICHITGDNKFNAAFQLSGFKEHKKITQVFNFNLKSNLLIENQEKRLIKEISTTFSTKEHLDYLSKKKFLFKVNVLKQILYENTPIDSNFLLTIEEELITLFIDEQTFIPYVNSFNIKKHILAGIHFIYKNPKKRIKDICFISEHEKNKILYTWNKTENPYPNNTNIPFLIDKITALYPENQAVSYEDICMTYDELTKKANQLANYLTLHGLKKNQYVAVYLERSIDFIISILAILKIGAIYVPIDPQNPLHRAIAFIDNCQAKFIICQHSNLFCKIPAHIISLKEECRHIAKSSHIFKNAKIRSSSAAYLMYTSGTTGIPKGVLISHRNIINYATWFANEFKLSFHSVIDFSSSISFDISIACTLSPLLTGAKIAICDILSKLDPWLYVKHLQKNKVTHIELTPEFFENLLVFEEEIRALKTLKWVLLGGDALVKKDIDKWLQIRKKDKIVNEYGPTECTVAMTSNILTNSSKTVDQNIPIGKPMYNTKVYVLDHFLNLLPPLFPGELYISGDCTAIGYLDKNQTKQRFIKNPYNKKEYGKMYKTGDRAFWDKNGKLRLLGRLDHLTKIKGHFVDPAGVENYISSYPCVYKNKVVVCGNATNKHLVAFIITNDSDKFEKEIREHLKKYLPEYMIPTKFIFIDKLPMNVNEKIDIAKLKIEYENTYLIEQKLEPVTKNDVLTVLKKTWEKLLKISNIEINQNFFDLGGDSLMLIKMISEVYKKLSIRLNIETIFRNPTIETLENHINKLNFTSTDIPNISNKKPTVICLNKATPRRNLFLIPSLGRTAYIFKELIKTLNINITSYVLQDPCINDPLIKFSSLEEMGSYYVHEIKNIQNSGSYFIMGASFGATLAVEIAKQLTTMGNKVAFIGSIDGWAFYPQKLLNKDFFYTMMKKKLKGLDFDDKEKILNMQYEREKLLFTYVIPPLANNFILFKSKDITPLFEENKDATNGWGQYSKESIAIYECPGDHESILNNPNVKFLAEKIKHSLKNFEISSNEN